MLHNPMPTGRPPTIAAASSAAATVPAAADAIRVMLVDDSAVIRGIISRTLREDPGIQIVATAGNGQAAIERATQQPLDVIVLDIDMPVMDGLTALPKLLEAAPGVKIIMASTLTTRNAEVSIRALRAGAADYLPKPSATSDIVGASGTAQDFRRELLAKVISLGRARRRSSGARQATLPAHGAPPRLAAEPARVTAPAPAGGAIVLRKSATGPVPILAIASSTGGPQALFSFFGGLARDITVPIVIVQHMPPTFTAILAEHIAKVAQRPCAEAGDDEPLVAGRVYVAPGGYHMVVTGSGAARRLRLNQEPPENFCRPAADPLLRSIATAYGHAALVVVLTGIGRDGCRGAETIVAAGGTVIAQDEESSVVWGMPGAVAKAGLCSAVAPPAELAAYANRLLVRGQA